MYALVQYDDRDTTIFKELLKNNKNYADLNGITYLFCKSGWDHLPPWWRKVFLVKEILQHYDAVLWVDSDATIVSKEHFSTLFRDKHFVLSPNPPLLELNSLSMFTAPFCAGIWGVRNTPEGFSIMDRWVSGYDEKLWKKKDEVWEHAVGLYGGIAYEQGYFESGIWRHTEYEDLIENKPYHVLNYLPLPDERLRGKKCPKEVFAVHYWKGNRNHIKDHWK